MFRVWGKLIKDNRLLKDTVICINDYEMTRTHKVYKPLRICVMSLIWLSLSG